MLHIWSRSTFLVVACRNWPAGGILGGGEVTIAEMPNWRDLLPAFITSNGVIMTLIAFLLISGFMFNWLMKNVWSQITDEKFFVYLHRKWTEAGAKGRL